MVKSVVITLSADVDFPDSEMGKDAIVAVGENTYGGKVKAIINHHPEEASTTVTLKAKGLQTVE